MTIDRFAPNGPQGEGLVSQRRTEPADLTDSQLAALLMSPLASCATTALDPDEWFPVATAARTARAEAAGALAVCARCPVRAECLEFSMRRWYSVGAYGIWGGLVEAERTAAYRKWLAGEPVRMLLKPPLSIDYPAPLPAHSF